MIALREPLVNELLRPCQVDERPPRAGPPRPICSGCPSACAAASSASSPAGISRTRWTSRSKRKATSAAGPLVQHVAAPGAGSRRRARRPTSRRSEAALPPTATATSTGPGVDPLQRPGRVRADRLELRDRRRIAAAGRRRRGSRSRTGTNRPLDPAVERPDGDLGRAAADVDHGHAPGQRPPERPRRAQEGQPCLLLAVEHADLDAAVLADRGAELGAVGGAPDHGGGDGADRPRADLLGERVLLGDDARGLGDPGRRDRPAGRQPAAQARERAPLQHLAQRRRRAPRRPARGWCSSRCRCSRRAFACTRCCHDGAMTTRAIEVTRPEQGLRLAARAAGRRLHRRARRGVRPAGPQRRRQDDHGRGARGLPRARRGRRVGVLGHDPGTRSAAAARARRDRAPELRHLPASDRARDRRALRLALSRAAAGRRGAGAGRAGRVRGPARADALAAARRGGWTSRWRSSATRSWSSSTSRRRASTPPPGARPGT